MYFCKTLNNIYSDKDIHFTGLPNSLSSDIKSCIWELTMSEGDFVSRDVKHAIGLFC
jgi:hypothetical protein